MKLLFILGSLEPQKDGVGDYVRKLAFSLSRKGCISVCVAISDTFVETLPTITTFSSETQPLFIRLPASNAWRTRFVLLNKIVHELKPDCVSLQYVPYAYSSKGLPLSLLRWLPRLHIKTCWHIMFHELWVDPNLSISNRLIEPLQKLILKLLVSRLQPKVVHTSNTYYVNQLLELGINCQKLSLFSNIDVADTSSFDRSDNEWHFIFFGSIHPQWDHQSLLDDIEKSRLANNIAKCSYFLVGHCNSYGVKLWKQLELTSSSTTTFQILGVLSSTDISLQLQKADFGVSTTPSHLIEKSGSIAAMVAHGLQVIIPRVTTKCPLTNSFLKELPYYIFYQKGHPLNLAVNKFSYGGSQLDQTTLQFIKSISNYS